MIINRTKVIAVVGILLVLAIPMALVLADGDETLGTPSLIIAQGSGHVAAGTGMNSQPGTIDIDVPGDVVQVLLYWADRFDIQGGALPSDDTVTLNGSISVTGTEIGFAPPTPGNPGGPAGVGQIAGVAYRADITSLSLISSGNNSLTVEDFDIYGDGSGNEDGAALIVIYDDGIVSSLIDIRDGDDVAYQLSPVPAAVNTVPQTFSFPAAGFSRTAMLTLLAGDVSWVEGGRKRTSEIDILVDGLPALIDGALTSPLVDRFQSLAGDKFDVLTVGVTIPAGATELTVQPISTGSDPASLNWIGAALSVPSETLPVLARITGGGWRVTGSGDEAVRSSNGLTLHCDITLSNNLQINWDKGKKWHINKVVDAAFCEDDPAFTPEPPRSPADTYIGLDVGKLNNVDGSVACFILEDHGEVAGDPDGPDQALIRIWDVGFDPGITEADLGMPGFDCLASTSDPATDPDTVLFVPLSDVNGNLQFHFDQPHKSK